MTDQAEKPLVTVYIPTHNRLPLLKRAIASVFEQSFEDFELIVVNDASNDGTIEWLNKIVTQQPRLHVISCITPQGACKARNMAIEKAKGQYITGLDDDDEFLPHRLKKLIEAYHPDDSFVCHGLLWHYGRKEKVLEGTNKIIKLENILSYNAAGNQVFTETYKLKEVDGFDTALSACQDYDTWTRLIIKFGNARQVSGYSYIHHRGHERVRISSQENAISGYNQYYKKHLHLMTTNNKLNQSFLMLIATRTRYPLLQLLKDIKAGLVIKKVRYFMSSNFSVLAKIRANYMKNNN